MTHLLLLYRVIFYTFGFSILGISVYKYVNTRNPVIGSFLFLWSAMTATSAAYVINYYTSMNIDVDWSFVGFKIQGITVSLIGVALPFFVHRIFNIKSRIILRLIVLIAVTLSISLIIPLGESWYSLGIKGVMIFIVLSNIYSYIISFKSILNFNNKSDKRTGLFFMFSFLLFFGLLILIDIRPSALGQYNGFLFFPLFYMWIGGFCVFIGATRLNMKEKNSENSMDDFIHKYKLTKRESEIALLLAEGLTYKKIAEELFISSGTVSTHVMHIYEKTETNSKIQLNKEISKFK